MNRLLLRLTFAAFGMVPATALTQHNTTWHAYGGDGGGTRYSSLTQINDSNVHHLQEAWRFKTGELDTYAGTSAKEKAAFEATPVLIDNTLYFSTPSSRVFALNPATGVKKWMYDPKIDLKKNYSEITSRGVSVWPSPATSNTKRKRRIFAATIDGRLIAIDAATGKPATSFGNNGSVDLRDGYGDDVSVTSPPAVIGNLIVTGSSMGDNYKSVFPKGVVRAFDAVTGKLVWTWDPVPFDSAHKSGAANAWSVLSVDEKRNLVFVPTGSASPDYYGGNRPGDNLYANAVVALNAADGSVVWHFQVVHHDIWDYDVAAQPVLIDVTRDNKKIPAVAIGTKMGHIFVLDRLTGVPLFPVEERPVAPSMIAGEVSSPTQPFPVLPKPLGLQNISPGDAWGPTEQLKLEAEQRIKRYENAGIFTPPGTRGTLVTPGNVGGIHWGGMCYDPKKQLLITNINWLPAIIRLVPRDQLEAYNQENYKHTMRAETGWQTGSPYVLKRDYLFDVIDENWYVQSKPPWGTLNAVDLSNGEQKWQAPLGFMMDTTKYPDSKKWGSLNFGGAIVTAGNVVFVAATRDGFLRAFNANNGNLLWESLLPAGGQATPMTYAIHGKQYVVIAAGGHGKFLTKLGDYVVAYALPGDK